MKAQNDKLLLKFFNNLPRIRDNSDEVRVLIACKKEIGQQNEKILDTLLLKKNTFEEFVYKLDLFVNKKRPESNEELGYYIDIIPKSQTEGAKLFSKRVDKLIKRSKTNKIYGVTSLLLNSIRKSNVPSNDIILKIEDIELFKRPYLETTLDNMGRSCIYDGKHRYYLLSKRKLNSLKIIDHIKHELTTVVPLPGTIYYGDEVTILY